MPAKVPREGIQAYMGHQVATLTPPNAIWRTKQWFSTGPGAWLVIAAIVIALVGPMFGGTAKSLVNAAVSIAALPVLAVVLVLAIGPAPPGFWNRYSVSQLQQRYPLIDDVIRQSLLAIRRDDPEAEFEIAVLEWRGKCYGAILFQVFGRSWIDAVGDAVVQVYSSDISPVEFGAAYAVPAS